MVYIQSRSSQWQTELGGENAHQRPGQRPVAVLAFDFEQWSPSHSTGESGNFVAWRLVGTAPGWDRLSGGPHRHSYEFENHRMQAYYVEERVPQKEEL